MENGRYEGEDIDGEERSGVVVWCGGVMWWCGVGWGVVMWCGDVVWCGMGGR